MGSKRRPPPVHNTRSFPRSRPSVNPLKTRRRNLIRLLKHKEDMAADIRIGYERELATCSHDIDSAERDIDKDRMIKKYHMVRFFERTKAERALKSAKKRCGQADDPEARARMEEEMRECEVDLQYTLNFPLNLPYPSIFKKKETEEQYRVDREQPMRKVVAKAMDEGTLASLRDGTLLDGPQPSWKPRKQQPAASQGQRNNPLSLRQSEQPSKATNSRKANDDIDGEEDGRGFFE